MISTFLDKELFMVWLGKILVLAPPSLTVGVLSATDDVPIQITALVILAISVVSLWRYLNRITESHKAERAESVKMMQGNQDQIMILYRQNLILITQIVQALQDRPCIMNDQRVSGLLSQVNNPQNTSGDHHNNPTGKEG